MVVKSRFLHSFYSGVHVEIQSNPLPVAAAKLADLFL